MDSLTVYRGRDDCCDPETRQSTLPVYANPDILATAISDTGISYTIPCPGSTIQSENSYDPMIISKLQSEINILNSKYDNIRNRPVTVVPIEVLNSIFQNNKMLTNRQNILEARVTSLENRYPVYQPAPTISNKTTHSYNKS